MKRTSEQPLLVIDRSAPTVPDQSDVTVWLSSQRIFISSVIEGLEGTRTAAAEAVEAAGARPVLFERFGGREDDPEAAYIGELRSCDVYLGLLGLRYGRPLATGYSATHAEYNAALRLGQRVSVWVSKGEHDGRQNDFINEVAVFNTYGTYADESELAQGVIRRLHDLASEALSPWAKLGRVVFRVTRVRRSGGSVVIEARTRDDDVLAEVLRLREPMARSGDLLFTHDLQSTAVRVNDLAVETTVGNARHLEISLRDLGALQGADMVDVATPEYSPEDLTELALRVALFGEENPLGHLSFMATIPNPFEQITIPLSEEIIGSVIRLLLTESMVGSRRAERLTSFRLGPAHRGKRHLAMSWLPRKRYVNVDPVERHIEGEVPV